MRSILVMVLAAFLLAAAGCGKKAEEPKQTSGEAGSVANLPSPPPAEGGAPSMPPGMGEGAPMPGGMPPAMGEGGAMPGGMPPGMGQRPAGPAKQIIVPESVARTYTAAKVVVKKKGDSGPGTTFEVGPGKSFTIPGSTLRVEVGQYLPDFAMDAAAITSKSDEPNNPTVRLTVYDGDQQVYQGWAFQNMPEVHAFTHPEYSVILTGAVKAK